MNAADYESVKTMVQSIGMVGLLLIGMRYLVNKLEAKDAEAKAAAEKKDAIIAGLIEKQAARDVTMMAALERIAAAMDRMERHLDADRFSSGPHRRSDLIHAEIVEK